MIPAVADLSGHYGKGTVLLLWVTVGFFNQSDKDCVIVAQLVNSRASQPELMSHLCCSMVTEPCTLGVGMGRVVTAYMEVNLSAISQVTLFWRQGLSLTWLSLIGLG